MHHFSALICSEIKEKNMKEKRKTNNNKKRTINKTRSRIVRCFWSVKSWIHFCAQQQQQQQKECWVNQISKYNGKAKRKHTKCQPIICFKRNELMGGEALISFFPSSSCFTSKIHLIQTWCGRFRTISFSIKINFQARRRNEKNLKQKKNTFHSLEILSGTVYRLTQPINEHGAKNEKNHHSYAFNRWWPIRK